MNVLSASIADFCAHLRGEYGFALGAGEITDALRAVEAVGVTDRARVRCALRLVCCTSPEQIEIFERAFEAFFANPGLGVAQPSYRPRHTRERTGPGTQRAHGDERRREPAEILPGEREGGGAGSELREAPFDPNEAVSRVLRARYSPDAASAQPPAISFDGLAEAMAAARSVVARVRLGQSLRWGPQPRGPRFDLRRSLRASIRTGGDVVELRRLGHPARRPRFAVLIDGSRSMTPAESARMLQFAYALARSSYRTGVFLFSTELADVTRQLRSPMTREGKELGDVGEAWGGGTRIGANLREFIKRYGSRHLSKDTFVIIVSDGLDVGNVAELERAMRELRRRAGKVVWLNAHAGTDGYTPSAAGMKAALPHLSALLGTGDLRAIGAV
ncbi:MAG: vWA domain-containing protein [Vulcanimicrobiaceae bacterium]